MISAVGCWSAFHDHSLLFACICKRSARGARHRNPHQVHVQARSGSRCTDLLCAQRFRADLLSGSQPAEQQAGRLLTAVGQHAANHALSNNGVTALRKGAAHDSGKSAWLVGQGERSKQLVAPCNRG